MTKCRETSASDYLLIFFLFLSLPDNAKLLTQIRAASPPSKSRHGPAPHHDVPVPWDAVHRRHRVPERRGDVTEDQVQPVREGVSGREGAARGVLPEGLCRVPLPAAELFAASVPAMWVHFFWLVISSLAIRFCRCFTDKNFKAVQILKRYNSTYSYWYYYKLDLVHTSSSECPEFNSRPGLNFFNNNITTYR